MRPMSPRRRRAAVLAASTSCFAAGMLPMRQYFAHGPHEAAFGITYVSIIVVLIGFSVRELIRSRREEGCGGA